MTDKLPCMAVTSCACVFTFVLLVLYGCKGADDPQLHNSTQTSRPFVEWNEHQFQNAQAKITYAGEQTRPVLTIVFHTEGYKLSMERFRAVQHEVSVLYGN